MNSITPVAFSWLGIGRALMHISAWLEVFLSTKDHDGTSAAPWCDNVWGGGDFCDRSFKGTTILGPLTDYKIWGFFKMKYYKIKLWKMHGNSLLEVLVKFSYFYVMKFWFWRNTFIGHDTPLPGVSELYTINVVIKIIVCTRISFKR